MIEAMLALANDRHDCGDPKCLGGELAHRVRELFAESAPCAMPEPKALPGIGKVEIPEDAAGFWEPRDARAFAVDLLRRCDDAELGD